MNNNLNIQNNNQNFGYYINDNQNNNVPKKSNKKVLIIVLAVLIVIVGILVFNKFLANENNSNNMSNNSEQLDNQNGNVNDRPDDSNNNQIDSTVDNVDKPFLLYITDILYFLDKGTTVTGKIERGSINVGDTVSIVGFDRSNISTTITHIKMNGNSAVSAEAGDDVELSLDNVDKDDLVLGQALIQPGSLESRKKFTVDLKLFAGINADELFSNNKLLVYIGTTDTMGTLEFADNVEVGEPMPVTITLDSSVVIDTGITIFIRNNNHNTIAYGAVTSLLDD